MKTPREDRDSVIGKNHSIVVAASKKFKSMVSEKAKELGISNSSLVRMALNEFFKNH